MRKRRCAVLGATGVAGQQFIAALHGHPSLELTQVAASPRSAGKPYGDAIRSPSGMVQWFVNEPLPAAVAAMTVRDGAGLDVDELDLVFSAVESDVALELEPLYARAVPVISTASAFRMAEDVPLLIPPVNAGDAALVHTQRSRRGWKGFIAPGPNCTTTGLAVTLAPLHEAFGVTAVMMTSLQSVSGAGRSPGVAALDVIDNVIPHIAREEQKVEAETRKILRAPALPVSCTCTRVAVLEGHTEAAFVRLARRASVEEVSAAMREWKGHPWSRGLPSAPPRWIEVHDDPYRPQPRLDRDAHGGMATSVGRLREDSVLENGIKYVLVSHNTKMGAAKGALLIAELFIEQGFLAE